MFPSNLDSSGQPTNPNQNSNQVENRGYQTHNNHMHQSFQQPSTNRLYPPSSVEPEKNAISSLPPNVVSDALAKDPHQLLLAHLYNYLKENGMHELAKLLLSETGRVPNNTGMQTPLLPHNQEGIDAKILISSKDTFLLEWWCLMWTIQLSMNPNLNQMFNRPRMPMGAANMPQPPSQTPNDQIPVLLQMQLQGPASMNPDAMQLQNQQLQMQLQMQLQQQQPVQQQQLQQLQQLQQVPNPTPLQKQQQQVLQQRLMLQQQHQMANQQFMNPNTQPMQSPALKENGNFVVPVSNSVANKMPPPQNASVPTNANNQNAKNSMQQYQHQLRLQQMKLQYQQQQAQMLQRQQQGSSADAEKTQLQSPLLATSQQRTGSQQPQQQLLQQQQQQQSQPPQPQQQTPKPMDTSNEFQMNMPRNDNNFQKKQFMMKQGPQQQGMATPGNIVPQNMGGQQPQHQQVMMQMAMNNANQKRRLSANSLISPHMQENDKPSVPNGNDSALSGLENSANAHDADDLKVDQMPNMAMGDNSNMTAQQQHQLNLQMQLQQKRLKFIQQQQAHMHVYNNNNLGMPENMSGATGMNDLTGDMNYPGLLGDAGMNLMFMNPAMVNKIDNPNSQRSSDSSNGNNLLTQLKDNSQGNSLGGVGFIENDWLSQMGSGPGFA